MTPSQLETAGHRLYGRKKWKAKLADALAVNVSTVHRIMHRPDVPGPVEVAVKGLLQNRRVQENALREARRLGLVPRTRRKKVLKPGEKKLIPYAGSPELESE